jgi:hypothetical protein
MRSLTLTILCMIVEDHPLGHLIIYAIIIRFLDAPVVETFSERRLEILMGVLKKVKSTGWKAGRFAWGMGICTHEC